MNAKEIIKSRKRKERKWTQTLFYSLLLTPFWEIQFHPNLPRFSRKVPAIDSTEFSGNQPGPFCYFCFTLSHPVITLKTLCLFGCCCRYCSFSSRKVISKSKLLFFCSSGHWLSYLFRESRGIPSHQETLMLLASPTFLPRLKMGFFLNLLGLSHNFWTLTLTSQR